MSGYPEPGLRGCTQFLALLLGDLPRLEKNRSEKRELVRHAKRMYRGNEIDHYVTKTTGRLEQGWISDKDLICSNPRCLGAIPANSLFIRATRHYWNGYVWKKVNGQPFCRTCIPFNEDRED